MQEKKKKKKVKEIITWTFSTVNFSWKEPGKLGSKIKWISLFPKGLTTPILPSDNFKSPADEKKKFI